MLTHNRVYAAPKFKLGEAALSPVYHSSFKSGKKEAKRKRYMKKAKLFFVFYWITGQTVLHGHLQLQCRVGTLLFKQNLPPVGKGERE